MMPVADAANKDELDSWPRRKLSVITTLARGHHLAEKHAARIENVLGIGNAVLTAITVRRSSRCATPANPMAGVLRPG